MKLCEKAKKKARRLRVNKKQGYWKYIYIFKRFYVVIEILNFSAINISLTKLFKTSIYAFLLLHTYYITRKFT